MSTNDPMTQEQLDAIRERLDCGTPTTEDVSTLLAEVERLRARPTVDEDMVKRGSRAFYEYPTPGIDASLRTDWDRLTKASPDVADSYCAHVRAVLDAALGTGGGCMTR